MYVYIQSEQTLWTVGFYKPTGEWIPESDHGSIGEAAKRVHYLNGGCDSGCRLSQNVDTANGVFAGVKINRID